MLVQIRSTIKIHNMLKDIIIQVYDKAIPESKDEGDGRLEMKVGGSTCYSTE